MGARSKQHDCYSAILKIVFPDTLHDIVCVSTISKIIVVVSTKYLGNKKVEIMLTTYARETVRDSHNCQVPNTCLSESRP